MKNVEKHMPTQEFMNSLFSHLFYPLVNRPTRLTSHSATLIGNILTLIALHRASVCNCVLLNDISDHLFIIAVFADEQIANKTPEEVDFRDFKITIIKKRL